MPISLFFVLPIALLIYNLRKGETETLTVIYFPDNISYSFLRRLGCHALNFMEVFIGQPDLLDMDLYWLQDAEIELPIVGAHLLLHTFPLLKT